MADFEKIYMQYFEDVFRFMRGMTANEILAEEITEETFFKALKSIDSFRQECDIFVWLCQIAKNTYYSHLKKENRQTDESALSFTPSKENIEDMLADKELALELHKILHSLNEPYKEVFSLRVFGELPFKQIGLLFNKSEHWACVTYHRAKEQIQCKIRSDKNENQL